jgi:hypothetical protein
MRKYNHYGIPTTEVKENESYVEIGSFKFYSTPFEANEYHIQWQRYPKGHGLPEILTKVPHIAFQVDDLDKEIEGKKVILGPYFPLEGYRVAIIEEQGVPIEFIETTLTDAQVSDLEHQNYEESAHKKKD